VSTISEIEVVDEEKDTQSLAKAKNHPDEAPHLTESSESDDLNRVQGLKNQSSASRSHSSLDAVASPDTSDRRSRTESSVTALIPSSEGEPATRAPDVGDVVIWHGSAAAKTLQCRGWNRSDGEWIRRVDASLRKRDINLVRCAEDPKFRTRLCNHWDVSHGTICPMRTKNKCIFAHGPVELRVKETKRQRWGKLVDDNGDNKSPSHSGGEDTYRAARSIETTRKQQGKWNTDDKVPAPTGPEGKQRRAAAGKKKKSTAK
jgi:hypothetical protein